MPLEAVAPTRMELFRETRGDGPPMLLFHGGTGSHRHFARNVPALAAHFRVLAFDLPGYGLSPDVPEGMSPDDYLDWIASQAAAVPGELHLVGFSFGGAVASATARRLGDRVKRVTLIGPGGFGEPVGRSIQLEPMPRGAATEDEIRKVVAHNLGVWMMAKTPDPSDDAVDIQLANIRGSRFDSRCVSFRFSTPPDLAQTTAPVQIIWGKNDRIAYPSVAARAEQCRSVRPDIRIDIVPGAGHWTQFEAAEAVNALISDFHTRELHQ